MLMCKKLRFDNSLQFFFAVRFSGVLWFASNACVFARVFYSASFFKVLCFLFLFCWMQFNSYFLWMVFGVELQKVNEKQKTKLCGQQMCGFCLVSTAIWELFSVLFNISQWITVAKYSHHCHINPNHIGLHFATLFIMQRCILHAQWWMCSVGCVWWHRCEYKVVIKY